MKLKQVLCLTLLISQIGCKENLKQGLPEDIKKQTQARIEKGYHLGTVIGIVDKTGTRYYGFGQMSLTDTTTPDENSIFEIASITKPFTTALIADLMIKNEIDITSPIEHYLPVFKDVLAENNRTITLEDLINHTSGLPRNATNTTVEDSNRYSDYTINDLNDYLSSYKVTDTTKTYEYSSLAYLALELAIEKKMKTTYEALIDKRILKPLDMNDSYFVVPEDKRNRLVAPFRNGEQVEELDMGIFPAGGGLKMSAKDMLRFLEAQLGMYSSNLDEALKLTQKEWFSDSEHTLGLSWSIMKREESGKTLIYHKGGSNGFVSFAGFNIEDQIGVVVLVNGIRWFSDLGLKILDPSYPLSHVEL